MMRRVSENRALESRCTGAASWRLILLIAALAAALGVRQWFSRDDIAPDIVRETVQDIADELQQQVTQDVTPVITNDITQDATQDITHDAIPNHSQEQKMILGQNWSKGVERLSAEAESAQQSTFSFLKQRDESPDSDQFRIPADVSENQDFKDAVTRFRASEIKTYNDTTKDPESARVAATAYLEYRIGLKPEDAKERTDGKIYFQKTAELAKAAITAGASDPLIQVYRIIDITQSRVPTPDEVSLLESGLDELQRSQRFPIATFVGRRRLAHMTLNRQIAWADNRIEAVAAVIPQFVVKMTEDPYEMRVKLEMIHGLTDVCEDDDLRRIVAAVALSEGDHVWLRHHMAGEYFVKAAWKARSSDIAIRVNPSQWKSFESLLKSAEKHLTFAFSQRPDFPESPEELISVAMGGESDRSTRFWFFQTVRAQPDYFAAYEQYVYSLTARWGGSPKEILSFAEECLDTQRFDLHIPQFALTAVEAFQRDLEFVDAGSFRARFSDAATDDARISAEEQAGLDLVKRLLPQLREQKNSDGVSILKAASGAYRGRLIKQLERTGDFRSITEVLDAGGDQDPQWNYETLIMSGDARRALWRTSATEQAKEYQNFFDDLTRLLTVPDSVSDTDAIVKKLEHLRSQPSSETGKPLLDFAERRIRLRQAFDTGDWVSLPVSGEDIDLWWFSGRYQNIDSETVELSNQNNEIGIQMQMRMGFPMPFEFDAGIDHLEGRQTDRPMGILVGDYVDSTGSLDRSGASVQLYRPRVSIPGEDVDAILVSTKNSNGEMTMPTSWLVRRLPGSRLGVMVWKESFGATLRGEGILLRPETNSTWEASSVVSIGELNPRQRGAHAILRVTRPRIRKLPFGPPPAFNADIDTKTAYYKGVVEARPENADGHRSLYFLLREKDPAQAEKHLKRALELAPDMAGLHHDLAVYALRNFDFTTALKELEAEFRVNPQEYRVRAWLIRLLICHPESSLRNPARAKELFTSSDVGAEHFPTNKRYDLALAQPMLLAENGNYDEALQLLNVLEERFAEEPLEYQMYQQQKAAFAAGQMYRIDTDGLKSLPISPTK